MRKIEVIFDATKIESPEMHIDFRVDFDNSSDQDKAQVTLYNLSEDTNQKIQLAQQAEIRAGYEDDIGTIFTGSIYQVRGEVVGPEYELTIEAVDGPLNSGQRFASIWDRKISRTYRRGIRASRILNDLFSALTDYNIGEIDLPRDIQYGEGRSFFAPIKDVIKQVASECGAKLQIVSGSVIIRPEQRGDITATVLTPDTGLIGSPTRMEEDDQEGYAVTCLLNHNIQGDSVIKIESRHVNGLYKVIRGSHNGSDFATEVEVIPFDGEVVPV